VFRTLGSLKQQKIGGNKMKTKKLSIVLIALLVMVTLLVGCGGNASSETKSSAEASTDASDDVSTTDSEEVYTLKWAHVSPGENDKQGDAINELVAKVEEESGGRLIIEHYPASILGNEEEIFEGIQLGTIEIGSLSAGSLGGFYPGVLATTSPFLFQTREEAWEFFDSETADWLGDKVYENTGVKVLGWAENGLRCFTSTDKQIKSPDDIVGMKIRTQQNPVTMAMVESLGGSPQPIAFAELYTALSQGAVDGQENPPSLIYTQGLYEVQPYLTLDYHVYDFLGVFANEDAVQAIPEDLREILLTNIDEFVQNEREKSRDYDQRDVESMEEAGVSVYTLTDDEYEQMVDATAPVIDEVRKLAGDEVVDKVLAQVQELRK
jgi:tripartite ATP-independent transporter DctP family solute receptor